MKYRVLIIFLVLFCAFLFGPSLVRSFVDKPKPIEVPVSLSAEKLMQLVNDWRVEQGFQPYEKNIALCRIAKKRVSQIATDFSHSKFASDYDNDKYPSSLSENLSKAPSEESSLFGWEGSKPHRAALEKPYKYSCIATMDDYAVQIFSNCENGCP